MTNIAKISHHLSNAVVNRLGNKTEDDQAVIAYGIHVILSNVFRTSLTLAIIWFLGYFKEYLIILMLITGLRFFMGGIHLENGIVCFFSTWFYYSLPAGLSSLNLMPRNPILYIGVSTIFILLTFLYSPSDNKERPFLNPTRRLWLKRLSVLSILIVLVANWFFVTEYFYFQLVTYTVMLSIYLTLPITYRLYGRRYRNYDYASEYLG